MALFLIPMFLMPSIVADDTPATNFHPYVEWRDRYERHINPRFDSDGDNNRSDLYTRVRVGADFTISDLYTAKLEYQNASDAFWTQAANASTDASDLFQGYLKYKGAGVTATAGRQLIDLGEQRLVGSAQWLNLARSFDAARVQVGGWDVWGGRLGVANTKPESARIEGLTHNDPKIGTTSLIVKHDLGTVSVTNVETLDHFVTISVGKTTLDLEGALQYGSENGRDQRAWAYHAKLSQPICPSTTLSIESNSASGGGDANTSRTFDNLYPSNHDQYGLSDLTGWKNMNDVAIKLENHSIKNVRLLAEAHQLSLRDASDGWYAATGGVNAFNGGTFVDPTGASGRDLGKEFDFSATIAASKMWTFSAGLALFQPGNFVQNLSGHGDNFTFGYLQLTARF